ncbi:TMEM121 domain-containing protein [Plasmodium brasilianum]|uniref:TMEM121 domain-containing protein n=1 Tax=Plasmodium brasilianum TaxID=5824 RepID=A0ACB9YDE0_PLABR|nr:TMEM121 domain-containing protein [Plasmodium brasilianum]
MIYKFLNGWRISFFFNLTTFIVQQLGLYYILFDYNKLILVLCVFDVYIFIHFCFNNSQSFASVKGGTCWLLYVYSISLKVIFMYFFAFNDDVYSEDTNRDYYNKCAIFALLSLSTLIYTALSVKSYKQLYPDEASISNEKIFHNNLILHVVIDLFDIFELLFTLVKLSYIIKNTNFWIKIIGGVLISFSLYLNAYSFPIISIVTEKNSKNLDLGDIYFCKKHAAVIGIILVDVPFMILRLYFLAFYFSNVHFQPLLIKNICFIPIKYITIKHCNFVFEKLRKNIDHSEDAAISAGIRGGISSVINSGNNGGMNRGSIDGSFVGSNATRNGSNNDNNSSGGNSNNFPNENNNECAKSVNSLVPYSIRNGNQSNFMNRSCIHKKKSFLSLNDILNNSIDLRSLYSLKNETEIVLHDGGNNIINGSNNTKKKLTSTSNVKFEDSTNIVDISNHYNGNKTYLREYFEIMLESQLLNHRKLNINKNKIGKKYIMNKLMYTNVSNNERYHCYLDDSLKVTYLNQIRLMIPYIIYCLGKIAMSIVIYFFYTHIDIHDLKIILTQLIPSFKIIKNIYIFLCSLSGRQFIGYIIRPLMNEKNNSKLPNFLNIKEYNNNISQNITYLNEEYNLFNNNELNSEKFNFKGDYKGFISIASLLIYINTKHMHGLSSLSILIIGNNFIKNLRLNYHLRNTHLLLISLTTFIRFSLLLFMYIHYKAITTSYQYVMYFYYAIISVFLVDALFKCFYMVISHNLRLITAYNLELKSIYEDIYFNNKWKKENAKYCLKHLYKKYQMNRFYYNNIPLFS